MKAELHSPHWTSGFKSMDLREPFRYDALTMESAIDAPETIPTGSTTRMTNSDGDFLIDFDFRPGAYAPKTTNHLKEETMATKTKTAAPTETTTAAAANAPAMQFVPLDMIEALPQVRTTFDEAALHELAESIKTMGVMSPVLLRDNGPNIKFELIAGERRVRAARLAGLSHIPALIGTVDKDRAQLMQLTENIQREDLSLQETAEAVRTLLVVHGTQKALCDLLKKSPSWVSKRVAIAHGLDGRVERWMASGTVDDLEFALALNQLAKQFNGPHYPEIYKLFEKVDQKKAKRKDAQDLIAAIKEKDAKAKAAAKKAPTKKAGTQAGLDLGKQQPAFNPQAWLYNASQTFNTTDPETLGKLVDALKDDERTAIEKEVADDYQSGAKFDKDTTVVKLRALSKNQVPYSTPAERAAFVLGMSGVTLSAYNLLIEMFFIERSA